MSFNAGRSITELIVYLFIVLFASGLGVFDSVYRTGCWQIPITRELKWGDSRDAPGDYWIESDAERGMGRAVLVSNATGKPRDFVFWCPNDDYRIDSNKPPGRLLAGLRDLSKNLLKNKKADGRLNDKELQIKKVSIPGFSETMMLVQSDSCRKSADIVQDAITSTGGTRLGRLRLLTTFDIVLLSLIFFLAGIICSPFVLYHLRFFGGHIESLGQAPDSQESKP